MDFSRVKELLDSYLELGVPGTSCTVYYKRKPVFRYTNGYADLEAKKPVTADTVFHAYSISKLVTCTAALQLYEKGKFLLDDPVSLYLPEFKNMTVMQSDGSIAPAQNPILIEHLFAMTAGLTYNTETPNILEGKKKTDGKCPTREMVRYIAKDPLSFEPGTKWQYSLCHDVLAALIEVLSGMTAGEYFKKNIFEPLGIENITFRPTPDMEERMAELYTYDKENRCVISGKTWLMDSFCLGPEYESGGAGLFMTVDDFAEFADALGAGELISRCTVDMMRINRLNASQLELFRASREPGVRESSERKGYGYGLGVRTMIDKVEGGSNGSLGEFGWGGAAGAYVLIDPEKELAAVYAQHTMCPPAEYTRSRLRNVIYACIDKK